MTLPVATSEFCRSIRVYVVVLILFILVEPPTSVAQRNAPDIPQVTRAYAIENVQIVQEPGRLIDKGTVVIRDGLIVAVGADVSVPYDARRIDGTGKTVYAAFIDGLSYAGIPNPVDGETLAPVPDRSSPPDDRAGIVPERFARDMFSVRDSSMTELRKAGFGAAHVVPRGQMLPGSGAVILFTGEESLPTVLQGDKSMFAQFTGASGMYPQTPMGITAKMRQLYRESERRKSMQELFDADPAGRSMPEYDAVHYAFFPVIDGDKPVFFFVDDVLEIYRALELRDALGFKLMLGGLNEAFDAVDVLKKTDVPMFVTLNLPEKPEWMTGFKADSIKYVLDNFDPEERTASYRDLEAERRNLEARALISRAQYAGVAGDLHNAGLRFGFSTRGMKSADFRKNLNEIIDNGLSGHDALAALTVDAAALLGLEATLGTVDVGKIANLIVADGDIFSNNTNYDYVFVDGERFFYPKEAEDEETSERSE